MTNLYFYNVLCSKRTFKSLYTRHKVNAGSAAQKFWHLLALGFVANPYVSVKVNSLLPINSKEQKKVFWFFKAEYENGIEYKYIPLINISIIRNLCSWVYVFFDLLFKSFPKKSNNIVVVDYLRISINFAVILACKIRGIKVMAVVTDRPGYDVQKRTILYRIRSKLYFLTKYHYYVCLTEELNKVINLKKNPAIIIEGFADSELVLKQNVIENKYTERVLIYAGSLYERYGIRTLIEAFTSIPESDIRLWIYGSGPFAEHIKQYSIMDNRIHYRGVIPNSELLQVLTKATLLINPRPTKEDFTKYSFPSKNLEYMSIGTPLLTTRLAGIPDDHYPYVFTIEEETVEGVKNTLQQVLKMDTNNIHAFGTQAKAFVMREKNNIRQAAKILSILD